MGKYAVTGRSKKLNAIQLLVQKHFLALFFLFPISVSLTATDNPLIINFPSTQYQAADQNWSFAQDRDGIMYSGNKNGLLEYDGANWKLYPLPNGQTARSLAVSTDGRIYCGSYGEFGYWKRDILGQLYYTSLSGQLPRSDINKEEFWHILVSIKGVFFQSFGVMYRYDGKKITRVPTFFPLMFLREVDGRLLVPAIQGPIYELLESNKLLALPGSEKLSKHTITAIFSDSISLLIGTAKAGVFRYKNGRLQPWEHPVNAALQRYQLNKALRLHDGRLVLGTILNGVFITQQSTVQYHLNKNNGLQNNTLLALFEDRDNNLWLGLDKGIDLIALQDPLLYYTDREGQIGTVYTAAIYQNRLYVGANQGVFYRAWPLVKDAPYQLLPGSQGQVWQLAVFDGQLLCGHNEGTFVIENNHFKRISSITGGWCFKRPFDHPDRLVQGTYTGLAIFQRNAEGQWIFSHKVNGLNEPIQKLVQDADNSFWAVNPYAGIYHLKLDAGLKKIVSIDTINAKDGLANNFNLDVFLQNGQIWIWSSGKQYAYNKTLKRWNPLNRPETIHPKFLSIGLDQSFEILPKQLRLKKGQKTLAIMNTDLATYCDPVIALGQQHYLLCLENGYALFNEKNTFGTPISARLRIKNVESLYPQRHDHIYRQGKWMHFPAGTQNLRFSFALDAYSRSKMFRYRLLGVQDQWSEWSRMAEHEFSNLSPGYHTLELQSDIDSKTATYNFYITPRWYQTAWMYLLYALLATGLIVLVNRQQQKRLAIQRRKLLLEKERELHQQRMQARNNQLQQDVMNKSKELTSTTFHLIRKKETLLQIREELERFKAENADRNVALQYQKMLRFVDEHLGNEQDWQVFEDNFNQVHDEFFKKLKSLFPSITPGDLRLAAYLRMNLSSKEIAPLLHLSIRGIENKRYRLRRKLELEGDDNLVEFLMSL
jgi:ligand-binding sensor domain-containing protein/DNA-binding CsgD family transcriptional regulator